MRTELEIKQLIQDSMNGQSGIDTPVNQRYFVYPFPQRHSFLSQDLRAYILREDGKIKDYLALQKNIFDLAPDYHHVMDEKIYDIMQWLDDEMEKVIPTISDVETLVINMLVYGKTHTQKMLDYNFKSLMAPENIPLLKQKKKIIFLLQTDEESRQTIESAAIVKRMKGMGVLFHYVLIPPDIIASVRDKDINYWMLGASASLAIHFAKAHHAAFHHSYPDIFYSEKFFSELLRLSKSHLAVLGAGMRSDECLMLKAIAPYETQETLCIPSADLIAHHLNCLHLCAWPYVVNNRPGYWFYPESHIQIWESENIIHFNTPHMMAYWLEYDLLKDLPPRFYHTLDSEMDKICTNDDYYIIQEDDEVYQAELSAPDRQGMSDIFSDVCTSGNVVWGCVGIRDSIKFFFKEIRVKVNRAIRPVPQNVIFEKHVMTLQRFLFNTMLANDRHAGPNDKRSHRGWIFE